MKNNYFAYALLFCLLSFKTLLYSEIKNQADRFAISTCRSICGSIQFPALNALPQIPVFCSGIKILTHVDKSTNSEFFTVPKESDQQSFYILITKKIDHEIADIQDNSNTVAYLKIPKEQKHKLFYCQLAVRKAEKNGDAPSFEWVIEERTLPGSGRIPDSAIILCCNPDYVESVHASHYRDLPTIKMRSDLLHMVTEDKMHDECNEILLASMDLDTIHSKGRQDQCIKITHNKVLIAPSIT